MGVFESPVLSVVGIALAIGALFVAYIFYRKARRVKEPAWAIRTTNLMRGYIAKLPDLDVLYDGQIVERLSISRILFWNRGADTIRRADIAAADPLRIQAVEDATILDVEVLQTNSIASQLSATLATDKKSAPVDFEFLDQGQGAVFQVVHSGLTSEDIQVVGTVVGSGQPCQHKIPFIDLLPLPTKRSFDEKLRPTTKRRIMALIAIIPAIMMWALFSAEVFVRTEKESGSEVWVLLGMALFYTVIAVLAGIHFGRGKIPAGLGIFEEIL